MPEYRPLHVTRCTSQDHCECFGAVRGVECDAVLGGKQPRGLPVGRRPAVPSTKSVDDLGRAGSSERYPTGRQETPSAVGEPKGPPPIGDKCWGDAHRHDPRGPAERRDRECEARRGPARAEGQDNRVRRLIHLIRELEAGNQVTHDGPRMRAAAGDPATGPERARPAPRFDHREGQRHSGARLYDKGRVRGGGGGYRAALCGIGLGEMRDRRATPHRGGMHGGREAMRGAGAADGDEHRASLRTGEEKLEPTDFVPAVSGGRAVFTLERELRQASSHRGGERRCLLERRGPLAQPPGLERRAYLLDQLHRISHRDPDPEETMRVATDYIRHAARAARKCAGDPLGGAPQPADPEFYKTLAKALEEIAAGFEQVGKEE